MIVATGNVFSILPKFQTDFEGGYVDLRFVLVWSWIITLGEALAIAWLLYQVSNLKRWKIEIEEKFRVEKAM
ncbi:hypothetical protein GPEL0_01f5231 [Geoanaerobacter pelophilus]|uniref:Uncharacterized protein n=1 Tax=Geoanaerobacter pelophilus TaxID=60036 RepID=A0ABQ0MNU4_9BACT|nr:hypothetical protein GPEL0_01f5231 [Geoanaerobacter pelophilus]